MIGKQILRRRRGASRKAPVGQKSYGESCGESYGRQTGAGATQSSARCSATTVV